MPPAAPRYHVSGHPDQESHGERAAGDGQRQLPGERVGPGRARDRHRLGRRGGRDGRFGQHRGDRLHRVDQARAGMRASRAVRGGLDPADHLRRGQPRVGRADQGGHPGDEGGREAGALARGVVPARPRARDVRARRGDRDPGLPVGVAGQRPGLVHRAHRDHPGVAGRVVRAHAAAGVVVARRRHDHGVPLLREGHRCAQPGRAHGGLHRHVDDLRAGHRGVPDALRQQPGEPGFAGVDLDRQDPGGGRDPVERDAPGLRVAGRDEAGHGGAVADAVAGALAGQVDRADPPGQLRAVVHPAVHHGDRDPAALGHVPRPGHVQGPLRPRLITQGARAELRRAAPGRPGQHPEDLREDGRGRWGRRGRHRRRGRLGRVRRGPGGRGRGRRGGRGRHAGGRPGRGRPPGAARACALPSMSSTGTVAAAARPRRRRGRPAACLIRPPTARTLARPL